MDQYWGGISCGLQAGLGAYAHSKIIYIFMNEHGAQTKYNLKFDNRNLSYMPYAGV